jgi:hypothetical protein
MVRTSLVVVLPVAAMFRALEHLSEAITGAVAA